ncbi:MAG: hypothetical protein OXU45_00175 [Candidatus Melainabacteria bacterium]|nr:hypothetical protein [Candidatus Melainabacteria bacterium]
MALVISTIIKPTITVKVPKIASVILGFYPNLQKIVILRSDSDVRISLVPQSGPDPDAFAQDKLAFTPQDDNV